MDVWSLCATFYHALKGKAPYEDDTVMNAIQLMIRKKDAKNFDPLTPTECDCPELLNIINHNLAIVDIQDDDLRLGVD